MTELDKRIIYLSDNGGVCVVAPSYIEGYTIDDGIKAIPAGAPYAIVNLADIPTDRSLRVAWTVDVADLTDGVGT